MTYCSRSFGCVLGLLLLGALPALAGDGVREINASCAAVGCWPGDDPGLPVQIIETGSYRLTSGLLIDENTTAIEVATDDVSIDLNGFTIRGPVTVTVPPVGSLQCSTFGIGVGIDSVGIGSRTAVHNGSVIGTGADAIALGGGSRVERVSVESVCGDGIAVGISSSVVESRVRLAAGAGIAVGAASRVAGVISDFNNWGIISGAVSVISNSVATASRITGMILQDGGSVVSNCSVSLTAGGSGIVANNGPNLLTDNFLGWSSGRFGYFEPSGLSGFGGNVFNGNGLGGANDGANTQCNVVDGISYCPSHP